jgi:5-methyltetrahydropteroyltriglutamate--homocysteine methyltransferase
VDEAAFRIRLEDAVHDVVGRQATTSIDIPNDGEYGHSMGSKVDYAAWWTYVFERLGGTELADVDLMEHAAGARRSPGRST